MLPAAHKKKKMNARGNKVALITCGRGRGEKRGKEREGGGQPLGLCPATSHLFWPLAACGACAAHFVCR